ncbi:hypothetical protein [Kordiimonas sp.]|uniref:hypothetical protein n=1 Tax=Kordiimonas sp. TaxID=1970157 RepID=UPI003B5282E8
MKQFLSAGIRRYKRQLDENGYMVLRNFLPPEDQKRFVQMGSAAFEGEAQGCRHHSNEVAHFIISDACSVQFSNSLWIGEHSSGASHFLQTIFEKAFATDLATLYLGPSAIFGARIQLVKSRHVARVPSVIPYVPHFDRVRTLKFYFYLSDVAATGGHLYVGDACWVKQSEAIRSLYKKSSHSYLEIPDDALREYTGGFTKVEAALGDIVVFDSSQPHFHGPVHEGQERVVLIFEVQSFDEVMYGYNVALQQSLEVAKRESVDKSAVA